MSPCRALVSILVAAALAGCAPEKEPAPASSTAALTDPDHPGEDVPAPAAPDAAAPVAPPATPGEGEGDGARIGFDGVAGVAFGGSPEPLRTAFAEGVVADAAPEAGACHFLYVQPKPIDGYGIALMVEGGRFVRVDVDAPDVRAPGGGHAGMTLEQLRAAYAGRLQEQPHKYEEGGKVVVVPAPAGGAAKLVFEVDAAGTVTQWRAGLPPQVDYVEGCA
jgi:hypothetical protein